MLKSLRGLRKRLGKLKKKIDVPNIKAPWYQALSHRRLGVAAYATAETAMIHRVPSYRFIKLQPIQSNTTPLQKASSMCSCRVTPYHFRRL